MNLLSPAKINLFLEVTGKRSDGYHTLKTLMCRIGVYDQIKLDFDAKTISVWCDDPSIPVDTTNTAFRAAEIFFLAYGHRFENVTKRAVRIYIQKNIPIGAGLGGGSSNAATVLKGLNYRFGQPFTATELMEMGLDVGADVPFFIFEKPAIATGIGDIFVPYQYLSPLFVLLVYPGLAVSTADIYKNLNLALTNCKKHLKDIDFNEGGFDAKRHLCNDLEPVTLKKHPMLSEIKGSMMRLGADGALMSGSGSTVFGLFSDKPMAMEAKDCFEKNDRWKTFLTHMLI